MNWIVISQVSLWILMIIQLIFMYLLMKTIGQFLYRFRLSANGIEEQKLQIGEPSPLFRAKNQNGEIVRLADHKESMTLLVFASNTCSLCHQVVEHKLPSIVTPYDIRVLIISKDLFLPENELNIPNVHVIESQEIFENYFVEITPYIILVNSENIIEGIFNNNNLSSLSEVLMYYGKPKEEPAIH